MSLVIFLCWRVIMSATLTNRTLYMPESRGPPQTGLVLSGFSISNVLIIEIRSPPVHHHHHISYCPLLNIGLPNWFPAWPSDATCIQKLPAVLTRSSVHLAGGRYMMRFPIRRLTLSHSIIFFAISRPIFALCCLSTTIVLLRPPYYGTYNITGRHVCVLT